MTKKKGRYYVALPRTMQKFVKKACEISFRKPSDLLSSLVMDFIIKSEEACEARGLLKKGK